MKTFLYTLELNIDGLDERLVKAMKDIGEDHHFNVFNHGADRLVMASDDFNNMTELINRVARVCEIYGVEYTSLLE